MCEYSSIISYFLLFRMVNMTYRFYAVNVLSFWLQDHFTAENVKFLHTNSRRNIQIQIYTFITNVVEYKIWEFHIFEDYNVNRFLTRFLLSKCIPFFSQIQIYSTTSSRLSIFVNNVHYNFLHCIYISWFSVYIRLHTLKLQNPKYCESNSVYGVSVCMKERRKEWERVTEWENERQRELRSIRVIKKILFCVNE